MIKNLLEKLINKKYYAEKEIIENKLNVFYAMNKISDEDFAELTLLMEAIYAEPVEETTEVIENETVVEEV